MSNQLWTRDDIQFPRLLAEIKAVGLNPDQFRTLCYSMDLSASELHELFDRAEERFESLKQEFCP